MKRLVAILAFGLGLLIVSPAAIVDQGSISVEAATTGHAFVATAQ